MQQGGSQYGMTTPPPEMTPPFSTTASSVSATTATSTTRTHILGLSNSDHLQQLQQQQQHVHHQQQISGDAAAIPMVVAEAASPISSRPPQQRGNLDELGMPISSSGYPDDEGLGGEEGERGFSGGNRWPRQETIALLKIRSEMDAAFRDATLKGPLWEDVSRKLAEQGYHRSAKKCKEKFENVHKYYKRTKEGRAGRQDGKSYRFFTQLEALHTSTSNPPTFSTTPTITTAVNPVAVSVPVSIGVGMVTSSGRIHPSSESPMPGTAPVQPPPANIQVGATGKMNPPDLSGGILGSAMATSAAAGISFSSNTSSSESESDHEDDMEEDEGGPSNTTSRKRKRGSGDRSSSSSRRMMDFFEGLMKQVMEKQEAMQQRFLETIEKREQDRMIREEAWKRQEMGRLNREHEIIAQERAISATRDASIITFLQKLTGQTIQLPQQPVVIPAAPPPVPPQAQPQSTPPATALVQTVPIQTQAQAQAPQQQHQQQQQHHIHHHQRQEQQQQPQQQISQPTEIARHQAVSTDMVVAAIPEQQHLPSQELVVVGGSGGGGSFDPSSARWPKPEVLALIKLRSGLESRYQEAGPKGPLWEEISAGMQRMGYNRSSKRCKEKWENINKYFKKVKESNKKRPEDAKTCPYFHQLDALYRKKMLGSGSGGSSGSVGNPNKQEQQHETMPAGVDANAATNFQAVMAAPPQQQPQQPTVQAIEAEMKNKNYNNSNTNSERLFQEGNSGGGVAAAAVKKPEDININIMKELIDLHQQQQLSMDDCDKLEEPDSDNLDHDDEEDDEEDEEEDEEETKMAYKIQFQRQNAGSSSNGGGGGGNAHFLAMVQ